MSEISQAENAKLLVAPLNHYRVVGCWTTKSTKPAKSKPTGLFFTHDDYLSSKVALEIAASLNEALAENEDGAFYSVYDDEGKLFTGHKQ